MPDRKISDDSALLGANVDLNNDLIPIVDVSEPNLSDRNKKITPQELKNALGAGGNIDEVLQVGNDAGAQQIKNLANPTDPQDADTLSARQAAITAAIDGLNWKAAVEVASTGNLTLSGEQTIDGILTSANRVLVKDQSDQTQNGIYVTAAGAWTRATDANTAAELHNATVHVSRGTANGDTSWRQTTDNVTIGVSNIVFAQLGSVTPDWSDTTKGKVERAVQSEAETAADPTLGNRNNDVGLSPRGWRWAWDAIKGVAQTITGFWTFGKVKTTHTAFGYNTLTDAANITWDADTVGNIAQVTLGDNRTLNAITNPQTGALYILRVVQDGTGGRTLAFNSAYTFGQIATPFINSVASQSTHLMFYYDGTNFRYILPNGSYRFMDVFLENQKAASTKYNFIIIDDTGKIVKDADLEYDVTLGRVIFKGVNTLNTGYTLLVQNSNGDLIFRARNDQAVEFGGTSAFWNVNAGVTSGNAGINFLAAIANAFRFKDGSSFDYMYFKSDTAGIGRAVYVTQKQVNNYSEGFEVIRKQKKFVTSTTAATENIVDVIAIPSGFGVELHVHNAYALATNKNAQSCNPFKSIGYNDGGTLTGVTETITMLRQTATTGGFNVNYNNTSDELEIRFLNETGTGRQYDCLVDYSYILYPLPV